MKRIKFCLDRLERLNNVAEFNVRNNSNVAAAIKDARLELEAMNDSRPLKLIDEIETLVWGDEDHRIMKIAEKIIGFKK